MSVIKPVYYEYNSAAAKLGDFIYGLPILVASSPSGYDVYGDGYVASHAGTLSWGSGTVGPYLIANADYLYTDADAATVLASNEFTISFRFQRVVNSSHGLFDWAQSAGAAPDNAPWLLLLEQGASTVKWFMDGDYRFTSLTATLGTMYHHVLKFKSGTWTLYIDGALIGTYAGTFAQNIGHGQRIYIGTGFLGDPNMYVDHFYLWDRELTGSEVTSLFADPYQMFRNSSQLAVQHSSLQFAKVFASADLAETFDSSCNAASMVVVVRPAVGTLSIDEVRDRIIKSLPPGADKVYDLTPTGDYYKYFNSSAASLKVFGFDLVDLMRAEMRPATARYKISDWERLFGLETSRLAVRGTIADRQKQVASAWRAAFGEGSTIPDVRGAVQPLLNYTDASAIQIIETDRSALSTANSYQRQLPSTALTVPGGSSVSVKITVADGGLISQAGARLSLTVTHAHAEQISVTLANPGGFISKTWAAGCLGSGSLSSVELVLFGAEFTGYNPGGDWTLTISATTDSGTVAAAILYVEGIGRGPGGFDALGAAAFEWGVFIDPTLINRSTGGFVDYVSTLAAIKTFNQAHDLGTIIRGSATVDPGLPRAVPGDVNCIPGQVIPGT